MAKTDWTLDDVVKPEDLNQIGKEINQLREDVDNIEVPPASTSQAGIVQLSNAVDSASETQAATSRAVKLAYDRADQAFRLGNERKQDLVDALIAIGVTASTNESWDDLITKVSSVIRATGNANVGDVLSGKTFSNAGANGLTGTMPNRGAVSTDLTSQGQQYTIPAGYHNGTGKVTANISNLTAGNIRAGVTVGGVTGTFSQFSNGATATQILSGRSAAVNGTTVNGSMPNRTGHVTGQSISRSGTTLRIRPPQGYYPGDAGNSLQWNDPNWKAENIPDDITGGIFGLVGTMKRLRYATGTGVQPNGKTPATVTGIGFTPKLVIAYVTTNVIYSGQRYGYKVLHDVEAFQREGGYGIYKVFEAYQYDGVDKASRQYDFSPENRIFTDGFNILFDRYKNQIDGTFVWHAFDFNI